MNSSIFQSLASKIANIFTLSKFLKRKEDNTIQVQSYYDKTIERKELFPYGFFAKAKKGNVIILCQNGNLDSSQVLPIVSTEYAPELKDGDAAIYNEKVSIILTEDKIKINGDDLGGLIKINELKKELEKNNQILQTILSVCSIPVNETGNGAPSSFQQALNIALKGKTIADFSNIENDKVLHGSGK